MIIAEIQFLEYDRERGTFTTKSAKGERYDRAFIERWITKALDDVLDLMSDGDTLAIQITGEVPEVTPHE